jgi:hypothetical protein
MGPVLMSDRSSVSAGGTSPSVNANALAAAKSSGAALPNLVAGGGLAGAVSALVELAMGM